MHESRVNLRRVAAVFLAVAPLATLAQAPPPPVTTLEEIVVTATKRATPLQDVPAAISALTADDILARGYTQYADYLSTLPGVYFADGGPGVSQIRIRGLSAADAGLPPLVASYFGETLTSVRTNNGGKPNLRLVDVDRVEVLRGPQGTLFGANALAGVVRIIPTAPDLEQMSASVGVRGFTTAHSDDESYHAEAAINLPLVAEKFAVRVVAYKDDIAGFVDNEFAGQEAIDYSPLGELLLGLPPGSLPEGTLLIPAIPAFANRDVNTEEVWGARLAAKWQASEALSFDLSLAHQEVTLNSEPFVTPGAGDYVQERLADVFERGEFGEELDIASLTARYDFSAVSLISVTSWSKMTRPDLRDIHGLAAGALGVPIPWTLRNDTSGEMLTQEVRLQSRSEGPLSWIVGAFYLDEDVDFFQIVRDYSCPACFPSFLEQDFALRGGGSFGEDQQALFGEVTYDFSPRWTLGVGARWLQEDVYVQFDNLEGFLAPAASGFSAEESVSEFNPSAFLQFKPVPTTTLYLQAARGFRSATPNQPLPESCQEEADEVGLGPLSDPDTLWNYEIGSKSTFAGGKVAANLAVYKSQWDGVQLGSSLACGFNGTLNGGDVRAKGVEIELLMQPTDAWRFNFAASRNDNEFESAQAGTGFAPGERLPGSPQKNYSAGAQYSFNINSRWRGFARADYSYVGDVRVVFIGDPDVRLDAFNTTNARIGFQSDTLSVDLYSRNLSDERAVVSQGEPTLGGNQVLIRPREIGIEVRYQFR